MLCKSVPQRPWVWKVYFFTAAICFLQALIIMMPSILGKLNFSHSTNPAMSLAQAALWTTLGVRFRGLQKHPVDR